MFGGVSVRSEQKQRESVYTSNQLDENTTLISLSSDL